MAKAEREVDQTAPAAEAAEGVWYEDWLAENGLDDTQPIVGAPADMDVWVDRRLAAIAGIETEMARNDQAAARRKAMIEDWRAGENAALERSAEYLRRDLEVIALSYPYAGKRKSRELPHGVIGKKSSAERLAVVDPDAALEFAREHGLEIKVKESVAHATLVAFRSRSGGLPTGTEIVPASEKPYVKAKGGGDVA